MSVRVRVALLAGHLFDRTYRWLLDHPCRASWITVEFMRPLPWYRRLANAWWQVRHFGDCEAFDALYQTWNRSLS